MIRIISGKHKGRAIPTVKNAKYRPSTAKFKESIFSILSSGDFEGKLKNASVLDIFAGTGSLAFEALSRGAKMAALIEIEIEYLRAAKEFAKSIGEEQNTNFLNINALYLPKANKSYDIVFMDPPYYNGLVNKVLDLLIIGKWLSPNAIIVVEVGKKEEVIVPAGLDLVKQKIYGNSKLLILNYNSNESI